MPHIYTKDGVQVTPFWELKEFWVNVIAVVAMILGHYYTDFKLSPEGVVSILTLINIALRYLTGKPIVWQLAE